MDLNDLNWDDIRVFVATARAQSFRQAAANLRMSHPTVRRRLESLEETTGLKLFQRGVDGLHPTLEGQELLEAATAVEGAMQSLARRAQAADTRMHGPVTLTAPPPMARLLLPDLAAFSQEHPGIRLIIKASSAVFDLARMEADVAIRAMYDGRQPDPSLIGRKAITGSWAVYGQPGATHWLSPHDDPAWVKGTPFPNAPVRAVIQDVALLAQACRDGMGMARLPCFLMDKVPNLTQPEKVYDVWVLVHPDLRRNPRLKIIRDALVAALQRHQHLFDGPT